MISNLNLENEEMKDLKDDDLIFEKEAPCSSNGGSLPFFV
jgi:hypothetical protein